MDAGDLAAAMLRGDPATWPPDVACTAGEGCGLHGKWGSGYSNRIGGFEKSRMGVECIFEVTESNQDALNGEFDDPGCLFDGFDLAALSLVGQHS